MPRDRYEPIKLTQTTRYAGYQFHARVHVSGIKVISFRPCSDARSFFAAFPGMMKFYRI